MKRLAPVPIPLRERWRDFRHRLLPTAIFATAAVAAGWLWKTHVSAPALTGQVEAIERNVSCQKPGMLAQLDVNCFQKVTIGDPVGQVLVTDPKILASSLAVIQAEIQMLGVTMQPIVSRQRTAMDYGQLRLDWMRQRAQLASAKVNLQFAQQDFRRTEQLFKDRIVSERVFEQARATQTRLQNETEELSRLVEEQRQNFEQLELTNAVEIAKVTDEPLKAAIAAQEAKLRLTEAELSPITLRAPVAGMVRFIYHRPGEAIIAGEPIVAIAPTDSSRIVSYLRAPILEEPRVGSRVLVRTRGPRSQSGSAEIIEVGTQFESIIPALQSPLKLANLELGLPIGISLPPNLRIRPGELVDLNLERKTD